MTTLERRAKYRQNRLEKWHILALRARRQNWPVAAPWEPAIRADAGAA
jgi:hypothetical protein